MHPLVGRLRSVRRRVRGMLLGYGLGWLVASVALVALLLCLADYAIHFQDRGIRVMATLACLVAAGVASYRFLWRPLTVPLSDVMLALRIEHRFPSLKDQLASTVEFLSQREDDPEAGSPMLRRYAVALTEMDIEQLNLDETVNARPTLWAGAAAVGVLLVAGLWAVIQPASAATAFARLVAPWNDVAWPKAHHLAFVNPVRRVALGQPFEVELTDEHGAALPPEVRIHYRYDVDGAAPYERAELMKPARGRMTASLDQISRPFQYRATGGDDELMPWIDVEVIEPPVVQQLTVTLEPPAYTGWPTTTSDGTVRALVGTRVALEGKTNKPIRAVTLRVEDGAKGELANPAGRAGVVSADGLSFELDGTAENGFVVKRSGYYTLDLEDREGFHGARDLRYDLRAIEDRPPTLTFEEPAADQYVSAEAIVPLRFAAKDDLALRSVELFWSRSDQSEQPDARLSLFAGPEQVARVAAAPNAELGRGESRVVEHRWNLAELQLKPGARLLVYGSASDYQPTTTQSQSRRLTILSRNELQDRLGERQTAIINELNRMLKLEREARALVSGAEIQAEQVGHLGKQDLDHLQQAELTQRQVERGLGGRNSESVPRQVESLLNDMRNNQLESVDVEKRLRDVLDEANRLNRDVLPEASRQLTTALKEGQNTAAAKPENNAKPDANAPPQQDAAAAAKARTALAEAGKKQDETVDALEQLLGNLAEWDNYRRFHRDLGQLRREQQELAKDTAAVGQKTLTQDVGDLKQQQTADLKKLGAKQSDVARNFDKVQQRMQQMAESLRESDPLAADTLDDVLHQAKEQALAGKMREAGRDIEKNQIGQATAAQQQAGQTLDEMLDILSNRRERELGRLVKKLREAEQQLQTLRDKQDGLRKKLRQAAEKKDEGERRRELERLTREQKQLQDEAQRFARTLKRLQADQAARSASKAGGKMGQAGEDGDKGQADAAAEQAEQAKSDLDDAQKQLAQARKQAEQDLAREQIAKLEDTLRAAQAQQVKLLSETRHYDELARREGLKRSQLLSLRDLGRAQQSLAGEIAALGKKLSAGGSAFELALRAAERHMTGAAEGLAQRDTTTATQRKQQAALDQLGLVLESLKPGEKPKKNQQGGGEGEGGAGQGNEAPTTNISELKLVKLMQQALNQRVRELAEHAEAGGKLSPEQQQEYLDLSQQQGELADLLLEMTKAAAAQPAADEDLKKLLDPEAGNKEPQR